MLTQDRLKHLLTYAPESGAFKWNVKLNNNHDISLPIVSKNGEYIRIQIDGVKYRAHRLAWLYMYGYFPELIDHINGKRDDNRLVNLRVATISQNQYNSRLRVDNSTGIKGVSIHKKTGKYQASCRVDNKLHYLGLYSNIEDAEKVINQFRLDYHQEFYNNGKYNDCIEYK